MKSFLINLLLEFARPFISIWKQDITRRWLKLAIIPIVSFFGIVILFWLLGMLMVPDIMNPFTEVCHNFWIGKNENSWRLFTLWSIISLGLSIFLAVEENNQNKI